MIKRANDSEQIAGVKRKMQRWVTLNAGAPPDSVDLNTETQVLDFTARFPANNRVDFDRLGKAWTTLSNQANPEAELSACLRNGEDNREITLMLDCDLGRFDRTLDRQLGTGNSPKH